MALSPMMRQYLEIKEQNKDCLLFFRLGDFYEMFFDDAILASRELDLTLTGRDCGLEERAPMCGVPYHSVDNYIARLIEKNYKIAICEQMTLPGKELVERQVVRIVTPGTLTENNLLDDTVNNYLAAVFSDEATVGIAWCDVSTGELHLNQFSPPNAMTLLNDCLSRITPSEIICNEAMLLPSFQLAAVKGQAVPKFSLFRDAAWEYDACLARLKALQTPPAAVEDKPFAVCAVGALLAYVSDTQMQAASNIRTAEVESEADLMYIDAASQKNLELTATLRDKKSNHGTLLWLLDRTATPMGRRLLKKWVEQPLCKPDAINTRLDAVEELVQNSSLCMTIAAQLKGIRDIERLSAKIAYSSVMPRDMIAIKQSLALLPELKNVLLTCKSGMLAEISQQFDTLQDIYDLIDSAIEENPPAFIRDGGFIRRGYSKELDETKLASVEGKQWIAAMEQQERVNTGIKNLRVGYNKVFGYYLEVTNSQLGQVPYTYTRKQTLTNCERFVTPELKDVEEKILGSEVRCNEIEQELYRSICSTLYGYVEPIQKLSGRLATVDCLVSLAAVAVDRAYVRPTVTADSAIRIKDGRHPTIEALLSDKSFVPNDTSLDNDADRMMVITGPNMAGKSTYMRQVALIVIMAHIGSFVPAKSAEIALTDRVFTRIGASDDLLLGHSTFMVEMLEVANILNNATDKSLLLLDEIGRGTSTFDGLSIAWSVMEFLSSQRRTKTLFSTHYHELTELEEKLEGVKNYRITVKELGQSIVFLHKIARGGANRSFGIEVAALAGLPQGVVDRARGILKMLQENDLTNEIKPASVSRQVNIFDNAEMKGYREVKDILSGIDFDHLTPVKAFELLLDMSERLQRQ